MKTEASRIRRREPGRHSKLGSEGATGPALCQALSWVLTIQFLTRSFWQFCDLRLVFRPLQRQWRPRDRRDLPEVTQQRGPFLFS